AAAHADAGSDAIYLEIDTGDRDLRTITGLTGDRTDVDRLLLDLGNLRFEQSSHEDGVRPRQDNLHAVPGLADLEDDRFDALAHMVRFAGNLLATRQDGLGFSNANDAGPALEPLHDSGDKVAF